MRKGRDLVGRREDSGSIFNDTIFSRNLQTPSGLLSRAQKLIPIIYLMAMKRAFNSSQLLHLQASLSHSEQTPYGQGRPCPQQTGPASCLAPLHERFDLLWS